jgi:hypothetical protein
MPKPTQTKLNMRTATFQPQRPRGRPKLAEGQGRSVYRAFKLTREEDDQIRAASKAAGLDDSEWMRRRLFKKPIAA